MCTAVNYMTRDHYFGRTLDYEIAYNETITITPRNFPFPFKRVPDMKSHYAIIGMATVSEDYPLYYDATNEKGLSMAGLLFPQNAKYLSYKKGMNNITPFEFIPWILGQCSKLSEAEEMLKAVNLINLDFSSELPLSPLHWIISDRDGSLVAEPCESGLIIYENPVGVLTNNPPFNIQLYNLSNYMSLSPYEPHNRFSGEFPLSIYSRGMGAMGLPGDLSSQSRFVRAAFTKTNSVSSETESESVSQFFHILSSVSQTRGCVRTEKGDLEITLYSSCCNTDKGIYYYTTYENSQICGVDMHRENLDGHNLTTYPLIKSQHINIQN